MSMGDVQKLTPAQESPSRNDQDVSSGFVLVPDDEDLIPDDVVQGVVVEAEEFSPQNQSPEKQRQEDDRGGGDDGCKEQQQQTRVQAFRAIQNLLRMPAASVA